MTQPNSSLDSGYKRSLDIGEYASYYQHNATCNNCGSRNHCYIPRGKPVSGVMDCLRCGCGIKLRPYSMGDSL